MFSLNDVQRQVLVYIKDHSPVKFYQVRDYLDWDQGDLSTVIGQLRGAELLTSNLAGYVITEKGMKFLNGETAPS